MINPELNLIRDLHTMRSTIDTYLLDNPDVFRLENDLAEDYYETMQAIQRVKETWNVDQAG